MGQKEWVCRDYASCKPYGEKTLSSPRFQAQMGNETRTLIHVRKLPIARVNIQESLVASVPEA